MTTVTRRHQRFGVEKLGIYAKTLHATDAELLNISMTGACVTARESLKSADKHLIKFHSRGMAFTLHCRVIWEDSDLEVKSPDGESVPVYKAGVVFNDTASDKMVTLKDFIRVSGAPNEQTVSDTFGPSALRFNVYANEKVLLYYPKISPVKKISLSGMLMELDHAIEAERRFPMTLFLPHESLPIKFQGRVACCLEIPDKRSKRFDIGIEFLGMSEKDTSRLSKFLQTSTATPIREKLLRLFKKASLLPRKPH
jgi:hypothetical protein